jgi:hypothetical protein
MPSVARRADDRVYVADAPNVLIWVNFAAVVNVVVRTTISGNENAFDGETETSQSVVLKHRPAYVVGRVLC